MDEHSNLLLTATTGLSEEKDLQKLLVSINNITKELLNADRSSIFIHDKETDELYTYVAHEVEEIRIPADKGIAGVTLHTEQILNIPDAYQDNRFERKSDEKLGYVSKTLLSAPVIGSDGKAFGVFQVVNKKNGKPFTESDVSLLKKLAEYSSSVMEKAVVFSKSIQVSEKTMEAILPFVIKDDRELFNTIRSSIIPLYITDNPETADVYFNYKNLQLEIFKIDNRYVAIKKGGECRIVSNTHEIKTGVPTRIDHGETLEIGSYRIASEQLSTYFSVKIDDHHKKEYFISNDNENLIFTTQRSNDTVAKITLDKSIILIEKTKPETEIVVNGIHSAEKTYVNLNDRVKINKRKINLRKIYFFEISSVKHYYTGRNRDSFILSNQSGDILFDDTLEYKWEGKILKREDGFYFDKETCPYDVYINDKKLRQAYLNQGDRIYLNGYILNCNFSDHVLEKRNFAFRSFCAENITHLFDDGTIAIDNVDFKAEHGEFIGILGPSGSGKSTLLNIMAGNRKPTKGNIKLDGRDLYQNYNFLKDFIGYVPQDDLLFENLTVFENLYYSARLRYPNKRKKNIKILIDSTLKDLGLYEKRDMRVGSPVDKVLSGGERKRLNIGLELLTESEIFILDEPTSGLSSRDSENIIKLLKKISLSGKIVFVVIHQPAQRIYSMFDKIFILDRGGRLSFAGGPYETLNYFCRHKYGPKSLNNPELMRPSTILNIIEEPKRDVDGTILNERKYSPGYWKREFDEYRKNPKEVIVTAEPERFIPPKQQLTFFTKLSQFFILFTRNFRNKLKDVSNLTITFAQAPLLAAIIAILLKYFASDNYSLYDNRHLITFFFLSVIVSTFFSLTNSADEIIKDAKILLREKSISITTTEYVISKFLTLIIFAATQNLLYLFVGFQILEVKELFWGQFTTLMFVSLAGVGLGLFISSFPRLSEKAAQNLIPLLLIPQIIFGGLLVPYDEMNKYLYINENRKVPEICQFIPSRWGFEASVVMQGSLGVYHPAKDSLQNELDHLIEHQSIFIERNGQELYIDERNRLLSEIQDFRREYKKDYGNRKINDEIERAKEITKDLAEDSDITYPLYSVKKKLPPFGNISTVYYNLIVLLIFSIFFKVMTIISLKKREKITHALKKFRKKL